VTAAISAITHIPAKGSPVARAPITTISAINTRHSSVSIRNRRQATIEREGPSRLPLPNVDSLRTATHNPIGLLAGSRHDYVLRPVPVALPRHFQTETEMNIE